jgi:hypothetical protein
MALVEYDWSRSVYHRFGLAHGRLNIRFRASARSGPMTPPSALSRHQSHPTQPQLGRGIMPIIRKKGSLSQPVSGFGNDLVERHLRILGGSALP